MERGYEYTNITFHYVITQIYTCVLTEEECSLDNFFSLVYYFLVVPGAYPIAEHLKGAYLMR
jgi:hypothetical protein